jgi:hypothetical protein
MVRGLVDWASQSSDHDTREEFARALEKLRLLIEPLLAVAGPSQQQSEDLLTP